MKVLVCGSRSWRDVDAIEERLGRLPRGTTIIHGGARGADVRAGIVARRLGFEVVELPADWLGFGRSAGPIRNRAMLDLRPDLVVAFWDGVSTGTLDTLREAERRRLRVEVVLAGE
ncbi:MAG TPA: SLOG family protein [Thermomicrobiales bacterium]